MVPFGGIDAEEAGDFEEVELDDKFRKRSSYRSE